jgi:hypothetical protein
VPVMTKKFRAPDYVFDLCSMQETYREGLEKCGAWVREISGNGTIQPGDIIVVPGPQPRTEREWVYSPTQN